MRLAIVAVVLTLGCGGSAEKRSECAGVMALPECDPQQVNERCVESCGWIHCDGDVVMFGQLIEQPDCRGKVVDAGVDAGNPTCDELAGLRVCSNLEVGPHCPTLVCDHIEWYRCPPGETDPIDPQPDSDCKWGKGQVP